MTAWDYLNNLTHLFMGPQIGNRIFLALLLLIVILTMLQLSRLPVKPWSAIARALGKALNAEFLTEIRDLQKQVSSLEKDLDKRDTDLHSQLDTIEQHRIEDKREAKERDLMRDAITARYRLIRCADEIRQGMQHSQEAFEQMLEDKDLYEKYCTDHPEFPNSKANASIKLVQDTYEMCLKENKFK
ncbi:MAG: hypothetical protein ACI4ET_10295 [Bilifractor sp.]